MKKEILLIILVIMVVVASFYFKTKLEESNVSDLDNSQNVAIDINNTVNNDKESNDIVGTWRTYQAIDSKTAEKIDNLTMIFGTSYISYGSYLELNEDGTFFDCIYPITTDETSTTGTYTIERDYYKLGDCYIFLKYSDDRTLTIQQVDYGDNIPVLVYYPDECQYQFDLKK